jgi:transposase
MNIQYFVGLDVHKQVIAFCVKRANGEIVSEGKLPARRGELERWASQLPRPWRAGMEATLFSGWIYRTLEGLADELWMGHPARMKAISSGKSKSDKLDARLLADLLRVEMFPRCYVLPAGLEALRRQLRFRRLVVEETVKFKNKTATMLMEHGIEYAKRRLHQKKYFAELVQTETAITEELKPLLRFSRFQIESLHKMNAELMKMLNQHPTLRLRVGKLMQIEGVGEVTALTWALEVGDPARFANMKRAFSYCGLTSAFRESAGKEKRSPISKQRNPHLQKVLIEAAKLAPLHNEKLKEIQTKVRSKGHANRATLAVARKLVAYLLAADREHSAELEQQQLQERLRTAEHSA